MGRVYNGAVIKSLEVEEGIVYVLAERILVDNMETRRYHKKQTYQQ